MTLPELSDALSVRVAELCAQLLPAGRQVGSQWIVGNVFGDAGDSLYVELTGPKQGLHYETITVCDMEDSKTSDGHEYRIYASNDTYKMADSWFGVKRRDTANAYGQMKREIKNGPVTYDVTVKGERWHTPTNFGNIVEFTKAQVQTPEKCAAEG